MWGHTRLPLMGYGRAERNFADLVALKAMSVVSPGRTGNYSLREFSNFTNEASFTKSPQFITLGGGSDRARIIVGTAIARAVE